MTDGEMDIDQLTTDKKKEMAGVGHHIILQKLGWLFCYKHSLYKHACMHVSLYNYALGFLICYRDSLYKFAHAPFLSHQGCTK